METYIIFNRSCLFKLILSSALIFPTQTSYARIDSSKRDYRIDDYETDGHYWTVLVVAALLKIENAKEIAYSAEFPDNVINGDGYCVRSRPTFLFPKAQKRIHSLTGGNPYFERNLSIGMLRDAKTAQEIGIAAHRLGDSFAHTNDKTGRMYPHLIGHTLLWKKPDKILHNPNKYLQYVRMLIAGLGGNEDNIDMSVFYYIATANLDSEANSAILKAEYNQIIGSIAFIVDEDQLPVVEKYFKTQIARDDHSYVVHSNTDGKGNNTTIIILTSGGSVAKLQTTDIENNPDILKSLADNIADH